VDLVDVILNVTPRPAFNKGAIVLRKKGNRQVFQWGEWFESRQLSQKPGTKRNLCQPGHDRRYKCNPAGHAFRSRLTGSISTSVQIAVDDCADG
jgi:hypothetical protein